MIDEVATLVFCGWSPSEYACCSFSGSKSERVLRCDVGSGGELLPITSATLAMLELQNVKCHDELKLEVSVESGRIRDATNAEGMVTLGGSG